MVPQHSLRVAVVALCLVGVGAVLEYWLYPPQPALAAAMPAAVSPLPGRSETTTLDIHPALGRCVPRLTARLPQPPQINVQDMADPGSARLEIRFWIDAGGNVVRETVASGDYGSDEERAAALEYIKSLGFVVPGTPQCLKGDTEMLGDFIETKRPSGEWATVVHLHHRPAAE